MLQTVLNNRYQIIKELGYGGFGTTYLAKDAHLDNSWCAIKKLNPNHADIKTAQKLFKREADTLLRLQEIHQVPKFIDYFEENDCFYIVEEYIEGASLENLLSHRWNLENVIIFLWDILSILQLLHDKNIIHRDIKPSNLIQRKKDHKFTIIDFGAVKKLDLNQQEKGTCIYHQGYTPVEQMQGMPRLNSDIYALGMTAIQLLTKEPVREFRRDKNDHILDPQARLAPLWLVDILNKMVRTDFYERYQTVEEVLKDLGQRNNPSEPIDRVREIKQA
ncbi:MAG: serine/threonine protein kinase [Hydrococcus sp. SU_1_0]|nr:serine/threonine protein kinase [Hydrococcus sp. SU_1_0]